MSQSVGGWEFRVRAKVRMLMLRELTRKGRDLAGKRYISGKWNSVQVMQTLCLHTHPPPHSYPTSWQISSKRMASQKSVE